MAALASRWATLVMMLAMASSALRAPSPMIVETFAQALNHDHGDEHFPEYNEPISGDPDAATSAHSHEHRHSPDDPLHSHQHQHGPESGFPDPKITLALAAQPHIPRIIFAAARKKELALRRHGFWRALFRPPIA